MPAPSTPPPAKTVDPSLPGPSPDFRKEAQDAFRRMIKTAGVTIYRMPTSCELYIRQHLGEYEPERLALVEALRRGVPERIVQFEGGAEEYNQFLLGEARKLASSAKLLDGAAWGAVECWAAGVGRPVGSEAPTTSAVRALETPEQKKVVADDNLRLVMGLIAAAGGFLGGFLGNGLSFLLILVGVTAVDASGPNGKAPGAEHALAFLAVFVGMLTGGIAGGLGGLSGWLMGRGDQRPWVAFSACFGAALTTGAVVSALRGAGWTSAILIIGASFTAAYTSASSGGYRS